MEDSEERGEHDPVALAAHLRAAAIELLHGRQLDPGRLVALALLTPSGSEGIIQLWDVKTRQPLGSPLTGHTDGVAFSPDGKILASGSEDGIIQLWDVKTRQPLGSPLRGQTDFVDSVAFSPDGKTLASGGSDGTIWLWDVSVQSWRWRACDIANRNLTRAEWSQYLGQEPYRQTCPNVPL